MISKTKIDPFHENIDEEEEKVYSKWSEKQLIKNKNFPENLFGG